MLTSVNKLLLLRATLHAKLHMPLSTMSNLSVYMGGMCPRDGGGANVQCPHIAVD